MFRSYKLYQSQRISRGYFVVQEQMLPLLLLLLHEIQPAPKINVCLSHILY